MIPPEYNAQFVWRMEEILDLYEEPYDPNRPVVCFDQRPCQLCWPRCESRLQANPASQSVSTASMSEGVWPMCSWPSNPSKAEERSE